MVRTQELEAQLNGFRQREVALRNELMAQQARAQADTSVRLLEAERNAAAQRLVSPSEIPDPSQTARPSFASIPDGRLADSNARIRSAVARGR